MKRVPRSTKASVYSSQMNGYSLRPSPWYSSLGSVSQANPSKYVDGGPTSRVCNLYLQSDTFLWDHVIRLPHIRGNRDMAIQEITSIFTQHVQGAQAIYQYSTFKDALVGHIYSGCFILSFVNI